MTDRSERERDARVLIQDRFAVEPVGSGRDLTVPLAPAQWVDFARMAKHDLGCAYFSFLTAVDWREAGLEVICRVENLDAPLTITMRARLGAGEPRCPSLAVVYRGADWMERECYDLLGVVFDGHPDLRRILLDPDWEGHPLRKDYPVDMPHAPYR
jgi:NADH-quinone oxidoreductase subunit C